MIERGRSGSGLAAGVTTSCSLISEKIFLFIFQSMYID